MDDNQHWNWLLWYVLSLQIETLVIYNLADNKFYFKLWTSKTPLAWSTCSNKTPNPSHMKPRKKHHDIFEYYVIIIMSIIYMSIT